MLQVLADDFEGFLAVVSAAAKFPSVVEKVPTYVYLLTVYKQSYYYEYENNKVQRYIAD
jgi:hypothetical protein